MNAPHENSEWVTLNIDGRTVHTRAGSYVLGAAHAAGIEIPSLCNHPDLEPVAACRVCMVQVTHPDWKGWTGLVTSCMYPVVEGLQVLTRSEAALAARRRVLALLAARCPDSLHIRELANDAGASTQGLQVRTDGDKCIVCGLCTRVCEAYATSAITTISRGSTKSIGAMGSSPSECVGCGGCALVCPTGQIGHERDAKAYRIWERTFYTHVCEVERSQCIGCGSCEQSCPFSVARVVVSLDGRRVATIPSEHCRGCGACVGACPSGAIDQHQYPWKSFVSVQPEGSQAGVS